MAVNLRTCFVEKLLRLTEAMLYQIIGDAIEQNAEYIADLNRKQLSEGLNAHGDEITPDYTPATVSIKQKKGQPTDRVRLRDTGAFYESIFTDVFDRAFRLDATDEKTAELRAKYGDILGLTDENKNRLAEHIKPYVIARIRAVIL